MIPCGTRNLRIIVNMIWSSIVLTHIISTAVVTIVTYEQLLQHGASTVCRCWHWHTCTLEWNIQTLQTSVMQCMYVPFEILLQHVYTRCRCLHWDMYMKTIYNMQETSFITYLCTLLHILLQLCWYTILCPLHVLSSSCNKKQVPM